MAKINGCDLPEDLYYLIEKHVWAKPMGEGVIRIGMTSAAAKLAGGSFTAVTVSSRKIGKTMPRERAQLRLNPANMWDPFLPL